MRMWIDKIRGGAAHARLATGFSQMKYRVLIEQDEDDRFVIDVPALPGCVTQGATREEALQNAQEAIEVYLESLRARNEPIPPPIDEEIVEVGT